MKIEKITARNFRSFGRVIEYPNKHLKGNKRNLWRVILIDPKAKGWRIAYLVVRDKNLNRLECHPNTFESFEPIKGRALFFVAAKSRPGRIRVFLLEKPIILKKDVWHGVVSLTKESEIKITENAKVVCRYLPLSGDVKRKIKNEISSAKRSYL